MNKISYNVWRAATFLLLGGCFLLLSPKQSLAASGLMVIPPVIEKEALPGVSIKGQLELNNPTVDMVTVYPSIMDFKAKGETGEPDFDFSNTGQTSEVEEWFRYDKTPIALEKNQYTYFNYEIVVPNNAEPGGHYATIFFSTEPPSVSGGEPKVNLISRLGALILIKVPGAVTESLSIKEYSASSRLFSQNSKLIARLENTGNVHVRPKGSIIIKNMVGKEVSNLNFNPSNGNVLPNTIRRFEADWTGNKYAVGKYSAELAIVYGDKEEPLTRTIDFWIFPWWALAAAVAVVFIFVILNKRRGRRHSRWR